MAANSAKADRTSNLDTPSGLPPSVIKNIGTALTVLLADVFALYVKTKNFHWHMSGPYFRDYHLLLDEQSNQIFSMTDVIAERVRKIGGTTVRSVSHIARLQRLPENEADSVAPANMLAELCRDNKSFIQSLREAHRLCDEHGDIATASLIENWIDETEGRVWFLTEAGRRT
jgi:starvation-inducible DNA-binding protein